MIAGLDPIGTIMDKASTILVYSDYKSPYAFLAKDLIYELEDQFEVHLEWLPYTLDIPSYLGSARLDERGEVIEFEPECPSVASSALLIHGLQAASPQTRPRDSWNAQDMGFFSLQQLACCGLNAKVNVSFALITIVSLNVSGDASLTLKTLRQWQLYYLKSMPTGLVSAVI